MTTSAVLLAGLLASCAEPDASADRGPAGVPGRNASGDAAAADGGRKQTIEIRGFAYLPPAMRVRAGDTVEWINRDAVPHTATGRGSRLDTGDIPAGEAGRAVLTEPGTYAYVCAYHPSMIARLVVQ